MCSVLLLYSSIIVINKPHLGAHRFFIITYWISVFCHRECGKIYSFPLKIVFFIYFLSLVCSCIYAPQIAFFYKFYKPFILMISTFLLLVMGFVSDEKINLLSKPVIITIYIVVLYGVYSFFSHSDPLRSVISQKDFYAYFFGGRQRVASTWSHPISYGFICSVLFFVVFKEYYKKDRFLLLILLFINIFICGSRTAILTFFVMMCIYLQYGYSLRLKVKYVFTAILFFLLLLLIPYTSEKILQFYLTISNESDVGGSSLEMRERQFNAVIDISRDFILTGGGIDYAKEVLGVGKGFVEDIYGMESYLFSIIMERGILGLCSECLLFVSLLYIYATYSRPQHDRVYFLTSLLGYYTFGFSTGRLDSHTIPLFLAGLMMSRMSASHCKSCDLV